MLCTLHGSSFFSPRSAKGSSKPAKDSIAGKKRPSSDEGDLRDENKSKGPVTSASESPVFKSKSKRRRVVLDSDDEEMEGGSGQACSKRQRSFAVFPW